MALSGHSMVPLGFGQAILGGRTTGHLQYQRKIYFIICSQCKNAQSWKVSILKQELEVSRIFFIAIPIPDQMAGCVSNSEFFYCYTTILLIKYAALEKYSFHTWPSNTGCL